MNGFAGRLVLTPRQKTTLKWSISFSSPEAALVLVSTNTKSLKGKASKPPGWSNTHWKSAIQGFSVKSDKSDWLKKQKRNSAHARKIGYG